LKENLVSELKRDGIVLFEQNPSVTIGIDINRVTYSPQVNVALVGSQSHSIPIPYNLTEQEAAFIFQESFNQSQVDVKTNNLKLGSEKLAKFVLQLYKLYKEKEAISLTAGLVFSPQNSEWIFTNIDLNFDDSAFRTCGRQEDLHKHRDTSNLPPAGVEAEQYGIVFVPLPGNGNIGTLGMHILS
jgi:succinyl-CoA synthetase alpha subunit